jgi:hypothetical protein
MGSGFVTLYMFIGCAIVIAFLVAIGAVLWYVGRGTEKSGGARALTREED